MRQRRSTEVTFSDTSTSPHPDDAFTGAELLSCFSSYADCRTDFCHGRGECDLGQPGVCTCDDPAAWTGPQCDVPATPSCEVGPWSAWSACSVACNGGRQSRTAVYQPPASHPHLACPDVAAVQERDCNTFACSDAPCQTCTGGTSGPCWNRFNGVCYEYYAGTATCPAGTQRCGADCEDCVGSTFGPCQHVNDGTCVAFTGSPALPVCPSGTTQCGLQPPAASQCDGCWVGTSGECQQLNTVCWSELATGACPAGTRRCAEQGSLPAAPVASTDILLDGVAPGRFRKAEQDAFAVAVARVAGVPPLNVVLEAVRGPATGGAASPAAGAAWVSAACIGGAGPCTPVQRRGVQVGFVAAPDDSSEVPAGAGKPAATASAVAERLRAASGSGLLALEVQTELAAVGMAVADTRLVAPVVVLHEVDGGGGAGSGSDSDGASPLSSTALAIAAGSAGFVTLVVVAVVVTRQRRAEAMLAVTPFRPPGKRSSSRRRRVAQVSSWSTAGSFHASGRKKSRRDLLRIASHGSLSSFGSLPMSPTAHRTLGGEPLPAPAPVVAQASPLGRSSSWHDQLRPAPAPVSSALNPAPAPIGGVPSMSRARSSLAVNATANGWRD